MSEMRRLKGWFVTGQCIAEMIREGAKAFVVKSGVPETAIFSHAWFDPERRCFGVVFEDDSFPPVPEGAMIEMDNPGWEILPIEKG